MSGLSTEEILRDKNTRDPNDITSLSVTHKALNNAICFSDFRNLEKLDLTFNNLTSLKGLESCVHLKWLSVQQNKLQTLKGIESLSNLTVFNAGKNKLRSMVEVKNLVKLRALILNDNEISLISGLDQLKELNTLVLSRNPIHKMDNALAKLKSITKVSLSTCQLEAIDPSIKACSALEQLRLAHNDIKTIPVGLASNKKLEILDLGNNLISKWSDLEALSTLHNLKNLNLLGNPIADKGKLLKKIKKVVPNLQILNSKRMDQLNKIETSNKTEDAVVGEVENSKPLKKNKKNDMEKEDDADNMKKNHKVTGTHLAGELELDMKGGNGKSEMKMQKKKEKRRHAEKEVEVQGASNATEKRSKRKAEKSGIDAIDDKETPFVQLFTDEAQKAMTLNEMKDRDYQAVGNIDSISALVTFPAKGKKPKNRGPVASVLQSLNPPEVGLGGPSTWDD